jgi:hypothetical protein
MEGEEPFHSMDCLGAHRPGGPLPPEDTKVQDALGSVVGGLDAVLCQKNLVLHHSEFDGRSLHRVQSGQPMHRRMTNDAPEKVPCDAQR